MDSKPASTNQIRFLLLSATLFVSLLITASGDPLFTRRSRAPVIFALASAVLLIWKPSEPSRT